MGAFWLIAAAAPCVMAAPSGTHMSASPCELMDMAVIPDCSALQTIDCRQADVNLTDRVAPPDISALPPRLLTVASIAVQPARNAPPADPHRFTLRPLAPPLYLQHAALLI